MSDRVAKNIRGAIARGKQIIITCKNCNTITHQNAIDLPYLPSVELSFLENTIRCESCGYSNSVAPNYKKLLFVSTT